MSDLSYCVVMPSIRQPNLDYLEPLGDTPIIVVDDSDGNISKTLAPHITVLDYKDRAKLMGKMEWLIPQKNPSCKNLGLYLAYQEGYDVVILLDDDCDLRVSPNYLEQIPVGKTMLAHRVHTPHSWFNTMELLGEPGMWARGFPYPYRYQRTEVDTEHLDAVHSMFNEGLWTGTPDINGADKFVTENVTADRQCGKLVCLQEDQYLPLSIMNVQIHRDLIPAFYQPPDYPVAGGHLIRRHDDVWSMMVLKTLMDISGDMATAGEPIIWHRKEGDKLKEMLSEHATNLIQPQLFKEIQRAAFDLDTQASYAELAQELGHRLSRLSEWRGGQFSAIISNYGERIRAWAELFND